MNSPGVSVAQRMLAIGKESLTYGVMASLGRFVNFLLVPIYAHTFSPSDYGVMDLIGVSSTFLSLVLELALSSSLGRFYYEVVEKERGVLLFSGLTMSLAFAGATTLGLALFSSGFSFLFFRTTAYSSAITLALLSIPVNIALTAVLLILRFERAVWTYNWLSLGRVVINVGLAVVFVVISKLGIVGVFWAQLISGAVITSVALVLVKDKFHLRLSASYLKDMLVFGLPLIPVSLLKQAQNYANRFVLGGVLGLAAVGVLGFGARIVSILLFIDFAFSRAWHPHSMSLITDGGASRVVPKVLTLYLAIMFCTASGLSLFSPEIIHLIAPSQYAQGSLVVGFLAGAFIMTGSYKIIGLGILVSKKTYLDTIAFFLGFLVNVSLTFLLIHMGDIIGAAVAPFLTSIMFFVVEYKIAQRQYFIAYEIHKVVLLLLVYTILVLISLWMQTLTLAPEIVYGLKGTIFVAMIIGIGLITFDRRHFHRAFSQAKQLLRPRSFL